MPPRRCCCGGCVIATDLFNRSDAATLGAQWDEFGDWGIEGEVAYLDPTSGYAIFDVPHKVPDESMEVYYEVVDEADEAIYWILVNVLDEDNYHIAKFHNTAVNPKIELGKVVGGAYTKLKEELIIGMTNSPACEHMPRFCRRFYARIAPDEFCAGIEAATLSLVVVTPTIIGGGIYSGMGGEHDERIYFDNFYFGEHLETNPECPTCICQCQDQVIGNKLVATISNTTGRMTEAEDCTIELEYSRDDGWWEGSGVCCGFTWRMELYCPPSFEPEDFELRIVQGCINSDTIITVPGYIDEGYRTAREDSTCDPLYLNFGPFNVSDMDLACGCGDNGFPPWPAGEYYVEITLLP